RGAGGRAVPASGPRRLPPHPGARRLRRRAGDRGSAIARGEPRRTQRLRCGLRGGGVFWFRLARRVCPRSTDRRGHPARRGGGALSQLPDAQGCLSRDPMLPGAAGCTAARGFGTGPSTGPVAVTVSPDGRSVYTAAWIFGEADNRSAVAILARDPGTGALSQGPGAAACLSNRQGGEAGCARARAIGGPSEVTLSPDNRNLYVSTTTLISGEADLGGEVGEFARNPTSGRPTQLRGRAGCLRLRASEPGCTSAHRADVAAPTLSPDLPNAQLATGGL